jgi:hypothetical protein
MVLYSALYCAVLIAMLCARFVVGKRMVQISTREIGCHTCGFPGTLQSDDVIP